MDDVTQMSPLRCQTSAPVIDFILLIKNVVHIHKKGTSMFNGRNQSYKD